ncbi:hypothetical protein BHM03_00000857 [Ensete ventricosum]|uniref:RRM domain-containing protein n=1 Tax=Ensete ventricosum TaxID=4639 RepID=A0A445M8N5_ENSVE|nr:hypothetical protein BHM03_00000857 [Ensete ventricosum]
MASSSASSSSSPSTYSPRNRSRFGDTTFTKVFVGGLAWETPTEELRRYFEQFGQILEAVIITDKITGRSKGYGFVSPPSPFPPLALCCVFFALAIAINFAKDVLPNKMARFIPIPMAIAIPFYIGPFFAIDMCIGSLILYVWTKMNKGKASAFGPAVASGLICGDGLWALPQGVLALAQVKPPMCMKFVHGE